MHAAAPQLQAIRHELAEASAHARRLAESVDPALWSRRPPHGGWSVGECLAHLNLTSKAFLPRLREAVERGRRENRAAPGLFRRDFLGWLLCRILEPPYRLRVKTPPPFVPTGDQSAEAVVSEFEALNAELVRLLDTASGLPLDRLQIVSPFSARMRYSVYSSFRILPAHQRRHLWQAERALPALRARFAAARA